jgi:ketosteroid isomerase-like protein
MPHQNELLVRNGYEAFSKGDMQTVDQTFADDIQWHIPGRSQVAGDYKGKAEVFGFFGRLVDLTGGSFRLELHDVIGNDEHVVALVESHGEREGKTLNDRAVHVWHVKDGKATEFWGHSGDQYTDDEFWG